MEKKVDYKKTYKKYIQKTPHTKPEANFFNFFTLGNRYTCFVNCILLISKPFDFERFSKCWMTFNTN